MERHEASTRNVRPLLACLAAALLVCGCNVPEAIVEPPAPPSVATSPAEIPPKPLYSTVVPALLPTPAAPSAEPPMPRDILFQISTMDALIKGLYDGDLSCGELKKRGDFGIGTFNGLDGEMVVLDGIVYRVGADGKAVPMDDAITTPYANVTFFDADLKLDIVEPLDFELLESRLDALLPTKNLFYAIRVEGTFAYVKTRSVPRQAKPYPSLLEVVKQQKTFEFKHVKGTVVGFRSPPFAGGVGVPGYHLHFITKNREAGGHILELLTDKVTAEIDITPELTVVLPTREEFLRADLGEHNPSDLNKVER